MYKIVNVNNFFCNNCCDSISNDGFNVSYTNNVIPNIIYHSNKLCL